MSTTIKPGTFSVHQSKHDSHFNRELLKQYLAAKDGDDIKRTHYFNGRFENIYLSEEHAPLLADLKREASRLAAQILARPIKKMGCWCNAMGPGAETTLHRHDDDDEALSGVYYVCVPEHSGKLAIHGETGLIEHTPQEGQWVFFAPQTPHAVGTNHSSELRLSIAFNFS